MTYQQHRDQMTVAKIETLKTTLPTFTVQIETGYSEPFGDGYIRDMQYTIECNLCKSIYEWKSRFYIDRKEKKRVFTNLNFCPCCGCHYAEQGGVL